MTRSALIFLVVLTGAATALGKPAKKSDPPPKPKSLLGQKAPDFTLKDYRNRPWRLSALKGQKIVVIEFGITGCYCGRRGLEDLQWMHRDFGPKGVQCLAIGLEAHPLQPIPEFMKERKLSFPFLTDPGGKVAAAYHAEIAPYVVIVDKAGVVRWVESNFAEDLAWKVSLQLSKMLPAKKTPTKVKSPPKKV